jgi:hypothetical protein
MGDLEGFSYKRFPAERRKACVPVTSARPSGARRSLTGRAVGDQSGGDVPSEGRGPASVDFEHQEDKGVVEK